MRPFLIILLAFIAFRSNAQTSKVFCLQPSCKQTINAGDSATLFAQLTTADSTPGSFIWTQTGGPGVSYTTKSGGSGGVAQSYIGLRPVSNGTYTFSIAGTSASGITSTVTDTLVVNSVTRKIAYVTLTQTTRYTDSTSSTTTTVIK